MEKATDFGMRDFLCDDDPQAEAAAAHAHDPGVDLRLATSSSSDEVMEPICRRLRQPSAKARADADADADADAAATRDDAEASDPRPRRAGVKRKKRGRSRRHGPPYPSSAKTKSGADPVEDDLLLDCVLALRPHAQPESLQRSQIWNAIAVELKAHSVVRLARHSGAGLRSRLTYLVRVFTDPQHPLHGTVQGSLCTKLAAYIESVSLQTSPQSPRPPPRRRTHCAAVVRNNKDNARDVVADNERSDDGSDGSDFEDFSVTARNTAQRQTTPRGQTFRRRGAHVSCAASQPRGHDQATPPAAQEAAAVPASSAVLVQLMHQADRARREHYDMGILLARQSDTVLQQTNAVLEQNQRYLEQNQARMDDHRKWCARCLSLLIPQPRPCAGDDDDDPSDKEC